MPFRFKQFSVSDDRSTMKVGTDAVLLGAWANVGDAKSILDIGTGSGVIALMLAQRSHAIIDAIEPDKNSAQQAEENFMLSPWKERLRIHNTTLQEFEEHNDRDYDLIVSNPPFFSNSLLPPDATRKVARHTETLTSDDLIRATKKRLAVILPTVEGDRFRAKAREHGLHCNRSLAFYSRRTKPQERWLMEFSFQETETTTENLVLFEEKERWTSEYAQVVKDFLTKSYS